jgi:hypothetical protein
MPQKPRTNSEKKHRLKMKNLKRNGAKALFGDRCQDCGYNDHWEILEFHHVEPRWKTGRPKFSDVLEWKWERIRDELVEHCVLLCPNCHKLRHMKEDGEGRFGNEVDF